MGFRDDLASRGGVMCRTGGVMVASRYDKRRPRTGETLPSRAVVADKIMGRNEQDTGGRHREGSGVPWYYVGDWCLIGGSKAKLEWYDCGWKSKPPSP